MERLFIARHFFNDKSNNVKKNFEENWNISEDLKKKIRSLRYLLSTIATIVDILIHVFIRKKIYVRMLHFCKRYSIID